MRAIEVSLAIAMEEEFRGAIGYFDRPPHPDAIKPSRFFVLSTPLYANIALSCYVAGAFSEAMDFATQVYNFAGRIEVCASPFRATDPELRVRFETGQEAKIHGEVAGYCAYAFVLEIPKLLQLAPHQSIISKKKVA